MANINQVTLIGFLGQDPQVSTTPNGDKVARLSVSTTEKGYTTKDGRQVEDRTEWHDVVLWKHQAEYAEKYIKKGAQVYVQGKLRHGKYEDKSGVTRYFTNVVAEVFELLDRKRDFQQVDNQSTTIEKSIPMQNKQAQNQSNGDDSSPF